MATAPGATAPEATSPAATAPEATAPEVTALAATAPAATPPAATAPAATAPEATAPAATAPAAAAPGAAAPGAAESSGHFPEATAPAVAPFEATAPAATAPAAAVPAVTAPAATTTPLACRPLISSTAKKSLWVVMLAAISSVSTVHSAVATLAIPRPTPSAYTASSSPRPRCSRVQALQRPLHGNQGQRGQGGGRPARAAMPEMQILSLNEPPPQKQPRPQQASFDG